MTTEPLKCFNCESIIANPEDAIGTYGFCSEACEAYDAMMELAEDKDGPLTTKQIDRAVHYLRDKEIDPFVPEDPVGAKSTSKEENEE